MTSSSSATFLLLTSSHPIPSSPNHKKLQSQEAPIWSVRSWRISQPSRQQRKNLRSELPVLDVIARHSSSPQVPSCSGHVLWNGNSDVAQLLPFSKMINRVCKCFQFLKRLTFFKLGQHKLSSHFKYIAFYRPKGREAYLMYSKRH